MGTQWRSEKMECFQLILQTEHAHDVVEEIGNVGLIEFKDLNSEVNMYRRNFAHEVQKWGEMEKRVRYFEEQLRGAEKEAQTEWRSTNYIELQASEKYEQLPHEQELQSHTRLFDSTGYNKIDPKDSFQQAIEVHYPTKHTLITDILGSEFLSEHGFQHKFESLEKDLKDLSKNTEHLLRELNQLHETHQILEKADRFFDQVIGAKDGTIDKDNISLLDTRAESGRLGFLFGVLDKTKYPSFERIMWRTTRGNLILQKFDVEPSDEWKEHQMDKSLEHVVYAIAFQSGVVGDKIRKLCESFDATTYPCSEDPSVRDRQKTETQQKIMEITQVLSRTAELKSRILSEVSYSIETWKAKVLREKAIYHIMNQFDYDVGRKCLIAEGWCPTSATADILVALQKASQKSGGLHPVFNVIPTLETPPTLFYTNKFTQAFQGIVESYGVPRYQEINPTVFTIITFPFLFGVMFGDVGHGLFILLFALYFIFKERTQSSFDSSEILQMMFGARYVLLLMGLFSIYAGLIYNECFSIPMSFFESTWVFERNEEIATRNDEPSYAFGVDWNWKWTRNELAFYNSLKMKVAVILGVSQMMLGVILSCLNAVFFKNKYTIYYEFIPQVIMMTLILGYLIFLIILKWSTDFHGGYAPSLLVTMINIFLTPGTVTAQDKLYNGQEVIEVIILVLSLLCVPVMLFVKPYFLWRDHKHTNNSVLLNENKSQNIHPEGFEMSEVITHQVIHTIEFALGIVSNTASYLRLWALSLAHAELSAVFWKICMLSTIRSRNVLLITIGFAVWSAVTIGILILMESLSAFLHALRLHWVEFQNKFYSADGRKFCAFSFKELLKQEAEEGR